MTFQPIVPWAIFAVVAVALLGARLVTLRQVATAGGAHRRWMLMRWAAMTLAVVALLGATMRPALTARGDDTTGQGAGADTNIFLVVDRMVDARGDLTAVAERYPEARFAVLTFGAQPELEWPLSQDFWSLPPVIAALTPRPAPDPARADATVAGNILRYQLIQARQQFPNSDSLVVYAGAGAPDSTAAPAGLGVLPATVDGGVVLGHPADGRLDEATLRRVADDLGVPYANREAGGALPPLKTPAGTDDATETAPAVAGTPLYWLLALLAAVLLLGEIWLSVRELRQSRVARRDVMR
ncbi:hypothetical protein E4P42_24070 [Mycobacterium sp. PS03-16]|uniref:hypothetical protein n=1 Tax=Mycobacterium sp. PS03-16 TaxID=2559611 RepID=UPI00107343B5|nr:hypothetical protein [Mycobacterium sp. PS03-16]TFV55067.1 hypothetical protein E4P42_24070 [Mycobacterium sp. PS03-16]